MPNSTANAPHDDATFTLTHTFDAPRQLVYDAWTQPQHLAQWWGPAGCKVRIVTLDATPGGRFHYALTFPNGFEMWGLFQFRQLDPPSRIVWTSSFSDPEGNIARAPFEDDWPLEMLNTAAFEALAPARTQLTLTSSPHNATPAQRQTFRDNFPSMTQGWSGSIKVLADYLAQQQ